MKIKNKVLKDIEIEGIAAEGKCITHYDGKVVFVTGVAPGDVADIKIIRKKKSFLEAIPLHISKYSDKRQEPFCSHFGTCGGCKWQHISYDTQLAYKHQQVIDSLERIAKVPFSNVSQILPSADTRYYRNKLEFTFSNKRWLTKEEIDSDENLDRNALGFHIPKRFDKILDIDHCYLQPDPSNDIRLAVRELALEHDISFFDLITQQGFLRNLIIRDTSIGEVMVILQVAGDDKETLELVLNHLKNKFPEITSLNYVINTKGNETFHDLEVVNWHGKPYIMEEMPLPDAPDQVVKFRIGPKSFFQTNAKQANLLYKKAWELAGLTGEELVYDLYTGTGTIANYVAHNAKKVIGIEYVEAAIEDAKVNAEINNISNTTFFAGDMKDLLNNEFIHTHGRPDVIITDPPRAGMHEDVCKVILNAAPERVVYVSCNPATQARDIAILDQKYKVTAVQPVDMFPHTHHVENIVLLELKK
ncbi:23S rRNA (uracil(1939)-C(5))-methyltransferase RlmD [Fulvivirga kasyanovii]|uniref:23S rRNA (Uracil(1939)-C(5))-methyltransferase RlmD n=1 Tax=Fulvivirga kasyanovii TaxID=396812 RepID=A0ABW9RPB7_9BACT|nr:23S rRNA (uracil(1939)-C(5))-methyltransferase RlmD [Fulvivirga kasyanovii]MTI25173.1 23S rRNA (uracil(1939)-C(5))-methyltransferase RlmD [Fulvivirga kasyanovii]